MATIRAVAEAAGVSKTTVSFVMNNTRPQVDRIPLATRERIKACAAALGYYSNPIAASLRTGKRVWIGVMTEVLPNNPGTWAWAPFFEVSLLHGVQRKLAENGYFTLLALRDAESEVQDMDLLASAQIGGLILRAADARAVEKAGELLASGVPVVNIFPRRPTDLFPNIVDLDNVEAGRLAGELVARCGSRNPAFVTQRDDRHALLDRQHGLVETIRAEIGVDPGGCELPLKPNSPIVDNAKAFRLLNDFVSTHRPDALVALDGGTSSVLTAALDYIDVDVPGDISVIGFDSLTCGNTKYRNLSSVSVSWLRAGEVAAQIVVNRVENVEVGSLPRMLPPVFVPGDSTPPDLSHESAVANITAFVMPEA